MKPVLRFLVVALAPAFLAVPVHGAAPDASTVDADAAPTPPPQPVCAPDDIAPDKAVIARFGDLRNIYRLRVPGPRGEVIIRQRIDKLIARAIDVDTFVEGTLTAAWRRATPYQQRLWHYAIESMLKSRYLKWLRSPLRHRLGIVDSESECHRAAVSAQLTNTTKGTNKVLALALIFQGADWKVYDVTLDDVSLLETWRSRFRRIYRDGGIEAVDRQMNILAHRYGQLDQIPRPPPPLPLEPPAEGPSMSERPSGADR